jgi:hypothetical protein
MIRFFAGLIILLGVGGNDCDGKCAPSMDMNQMLIWSAIGLGLMLWSLPKLLRSR